MTMNVSRRLGAAALLALICFTPPSMAADLKDAEAALAAGRHADAIPILKPLAEAGDRDAQTLLGGRQIAGIGGPQDLRSAFDLFARAAEQGQPYAQYNLGLMYARGDAGATDFDKAAAWYRRSASQGVILANGEGVPADPVQAYVWLLLADRSGFKAAQRNVEILRSRLAAEERTKAEQAAAAWQPTVSGTEK